MLKITFRRDRCDAIRRQLDEGSPVEPGPDGWTDDELLLLMAMSSLKFSITVQANDWAPGVEFLRALACVLESGKQTLGGGSGNALPPEVKAYVRGFEDRVMILPVSRFPQKDDDSVEPPLEMYRPLYDLSLMNWETDDESKG